MTPRLKRTGSQVTWVPNIGVLEYADNVNGPWSDVPNATNPFAVNADAAEKRKFYRVRL